MLLCRQIARVDNMEAIGLAIGVPGLAALFLKAGLRGYEVFTNVRETSAELDHCMHTFRLEQQRLLDWRDSINRVNISNSPQSTERERYLLIVGTLARIACLFTSIAEVQSKNAQPTEPTEDRKWLSTKRFSRSLKSNWFRRTKSDSSSTAVSNGAKTPTQRPLSPAFPQFNIEEVVPDDMKTENLELLGARVEKSNLSFQNIRWAVHDKHTLEELLKRLRRYTQSLIDISTPLLSAAGTSSRQFCLTLLTNSD